MNVVCQIVDRRELYSFAEFDLIDTLLDRTTQPFNPGPVFGVTLL